MIHSFHNKYSTSTQNKLLSAMNDTKCLFSLVSAFSQKNKTYKIGPGVCMCLCKNFGPP